MVVKMVLIGAWWVLVALFSGILLLMNGWTHSGTAALSFLAGVVTCGFAVCWNLTTPTQRAPQAPTTPPQHTGG